GRSDAAGVGSLERLRPAYAIAAKCGGLLKSPVQPIHLRRAPEKKACRASVAMKRCNVLFPASTHGTWMCSIRKALRLLEDARVAVPQEAVAGKCPARLCRELAR